MSEKNPPLYARLKLDEMYSEVAGTVVCKLCSLVVDHVPTHPAVCPEVKRVYALMSKAANKEEALEIARREKLPITADEADDPITPLDLIQYINEMVPPEIINDPSAQFLVKSAAAMVCAAVAKVATHVLANSRVLLDGRSEGGLALPKNFHPHLMQELAKTSRHFGLIEEYYTKVHGKANPNDIN